MSHTLRPIEPDDHPAVLALNQRFVELVSPLDGDGLVALVGLADRAAIIEHEGACAGFVITIAAGAAYDSANYRWFSERYDDFTYLDRIIVDSAFQRFGLGRAAYDELEAGADRRLVCEVNLDPPNEPSLAFHAGRGYVEVGQQRVGSDDHLVSMLAKDL